MQSIESCVVVLGTGGTIAGAGARPQDHVHYTAGALSVDDLVAAVPALRGVPLEAENLAQIDSCDMTPEVWSLLARRAAAHLARAEVTGIVVTHGTDTLEETAYFLHRTVAAGKPIVLTAAMRPATALSADGPQNLLDAVSVARHPGARGVLLAFGGRVLAGHELRKVHSYRTDAFSAGDAGALALLEEGRLRCLRPWPQSAPGAGPAVARLPARDADWPWVEIVNSHAGAHGRAVDALVAAGVRGLVVAATGNGSVHQALLSALRRAQAAGVAVLRASRCAFGGVVEATEGGVPEFESAGQLTPAQARVELTLRLLGTTMA
jgi:L-asparaginase